MREAYTMWEKSPLGHWRPAMVADSLAEAEEALADWAQNYHDLNGAPPERGRDFRLTEECVPFLGLDGAPRAAP